jgi:hypothetical protein
LLDKAMDFSLAALIVTLVYGAAATFLALRGRERIKQATPGAPEGTVETIKVSSISWRI